MLELMKSSVYCLPLPLVFEQKSDTVYFQMLGTFRCSIGSGFAVGRRRMAVDFL